VVNAANRVLSAPFVLEENKLVVKGSVGNKSSGPNDFNFAFLKNFWYLIKYEVRIIILQIPRQ